MGRADESGTSVLPPAVLKKERTGTALDVTDPTRLLGPVGAGTKLLPPTVLRKVATDGPLVGRAPTLDGRPEIEDARE